MISNLTVFQVALVPSSLLYLKRKREEGRRKKEEGRRKKEEGRRKKEEGRRKEHPVFVGAKHSRDSLPR
jgi:hypothetical protein